MKKRLFGFAAIAALVLSGPAMAQTADEATTKELWCGTALSIYYSNTPPNVSAADVAKAKVYLDGATGMIDEATQKYLNAGYTEEQVGKIKTDLTSDLTALVTGKDASGQAVSAPATPPAYTFDDCLTLLAARLPPDASASSQQ